MNNTLARWETYSPVSIGLADMFNRLDALADSGSVNYPPYNIVRFDNETQELQIALAGFSQEDIEVSLERGVLTVTANHAPKEEVGEYVHRGIAARGVNRNWQLSDSAVVDNVTYTDGLLRIGIRLDLPEAKRRKVFPIS